MLISLPVEIETALVEEARKQGTTPELLAVDYLRERFHPNPPNEEPSENQPTLADFLGAHIGSLSSSELVNGGANMSEKPSQRFAAGLLQHHLSEEP